MLGERMRYQKVDLAYNFLANKCKSNESFSITELASAVGWEIGSCKTYLSKRWHQYILKHEDGFYVQDILSLNKDEFRALHSQKLQKSVDRNELLKKAKEFALLAVATYNNPFLELKTYGFIVNIVIAYTALFQAIFKKNRIDFFYKRSDGEYSVLDGEPKAWDLSACCNQYWKNTTAESANIEFLIGLRNKIEHRSLPYLDVMVAGYCQAALTNFESIIVNEFGKEHALVANLAIAMQLTRTAQEEQVEALKQFQKENYRIVREYMETFEQDLNRDDIIESQRYRIKMLLIPKIGNSMKSSDLAIEFVRVEDLTEEELKNYSQGVALIKGVESLYKLRPKKVVEQVKKHFPDFNMSRHTQCWHQFKARPSAKKPNFKGKYAGYVEGFDGYLYKKDWVDFLIKELSKK